MPIITRAAPGRSTSLWQRCHATQVPWLSAWPLPVPERWLEYVNKAETVGEREALRRSVLRGAHYGDEAWQLQTAAALGLEASFAPRGRPRKQGMDQTSLFEDQRDEE